MSRIDQLRNELADQIGHFNDESKKHKLLYRKYRYWLFRLTAASTILASLAIPIPARLKTAVTLAVIAVNALAAFVTAVEGLRKPADLWIHERNIFYALTDLQREIKYREACGITDAEVDQFFLLMQTILSSSLESWKGAVQPRPSEAPRTGGPHGPTTAKA